MIFSCTLDKELAWLHHRDLNALKAWAGKPETQKVGMLNGATISRKTEAAGMDGKEKP